MFGIVYRYCTGPAGWRIVSGGAWALAWSAQEARQRSKLLVAVEKASWVEDLRETEGYGYNKTAHAVHTGLEMQVAVSQL